MAEETRVRGFRLTVKSLEQLDKLRLKKYGNFVKLGGYLQFVINEHIERENKKVKK